jgi:hypothetical protein
MMRVYLPDNEHGVPQGYYSQRGIVDLLRRFCADVDAVRFIADMPE